MQTQKKPGTLPGFLMVDAQRNERADAPSSFVGARSRAMGLYR
ncbi:hypothetical protein [Xanthomonas campestris]|nr:hypothetical protein [Xanthomonas campestris]